MTGRLLTFVALLIAAAGHSLAQRSPEQLIKVASHHMRLKEIARIVENDVRGEPGLRRVTLLAEVVHSNTIMEPGAHVLIDWTVNLSALEKAKRTFEQQNNSHSDGLFLHEPNPPVVDANGEFWAHVAPAGQRLANVNRFAGAKVGMETIRFSGPVFAPVAAQFSFDASPK